MWLRLGSKLGGCCLIAAAASFDGGIQGPENCSIALCLNAENLCGEYRTPCQNIGTVKAGIEVWVSMKYELMTAASDSGVTHVYRRKELGAFTEQDCENGNNWLEVKYEGTFTEMGPSPVLNGSNIAEAFLSSTWIRLLQDEVCVKKATMSGGSGKCEGELIDTKRAIQDLCPCNDWPWRVGEDRNVGMFCTPINQCPVVHRSVVQQTQYFSYNASLTSGCFTKVSIDRERGWFDPKDDGCYEKVAPATCPAGVLHTGGADHGVSAAVLLALGLTALSALFGTSYPPMDTC